MIYRKVVNEMDFGSEKIANCSTRSTKIIRTWMTGDDECNAYSEEYACGLVYHNNYMDVVGNRDHNCFWTCRNCKFRNVES